MARYTVHMPGDTDALERAVFVRDGFSFAAFFAGPFWLIGKGAWISGLIVLAGMIGFLMGIAALGATSGIVFGALALIALLLGFEGVSLRRWELARRGWREAGIVVGTDVDALERRFFEHALNASPGETAPARPAPASPNPLPVQPQVLGLFPSADGPGSRR